MKTRLRKLRKELHLNQKDFGAKLGISDTAISKLETGENNLTEQNINLICMLFNVNEKWLRNGIEPMFNKSNNVILDSLKKKYTLDNLDLNIIETYLNLDPTQRKAIKEYVSKLVDSIATKEEANSERDNNKITELPTYKIKYFDMPASAGYGNPFGIEYAEDVELKQKPPKGAKFLTRVIGNSMEPTYSEGDILFVKPQDSVDVGDIGIFFIDGEFYVKERGEKELISHNKDFPNIPLNPFSPPRCEGKVLGVCKEKVK